MKRWHVILSSLGGAVALIAIACGAWVTVTFSAPVPSSSQAFGLAESAGAEHFQRGWRPNPKVASPFPSGIRTPVWKCWVE